MTGIPITWTQEPSTAHVERHILTAMIVSDQALRIIGLAYKPRYLVADFAATVAGWCLEYQQRYNCAPGRNIQVLFEAQRRNGLNPDLAQLIDRFLAGISQEYERDEQYNEQLAIDEAIRYFRERALTILRDDLDVHLRAGTLDQAHGAVADFIAPAAQVGMGFEPMTDLEGTREAFQDKDSLLQLPGAFGRLLGTLEREWAVGIVGKFKGAKSYTCQHIEQQSVYSGLNVAHLDFELGERRLRRRWAQGLCAMPLRPPRDGRLFIPTWDCALNQTGECQSPSRQCPVQLLDSNGNKPMPAMQPPGYRPCDLKGRCPYYRLETWFIERKIDVLDWRTAWRKAEAVAGSVLGARFKVKSWPKFGAGFDDARAVLQVWRHLEGFNPDVLVLDQPSGMSDLVAGRGDFRHRVDELAKRICGLAQDLHCLVLAPFQAGGKEAQERKRLRDSDVAEHAGILGHLDMTIKIDQGPEDELAKRALISVGVGRDEDVIEGEYVTVLQAISLGQAILDSRF